MKLDNFGNPAAARIYNSVKVLSGMVNLSDVISKNSMMAKQAAT